MAGLLTSSAYGKYKLGNKAKLTLQIINPYNVIISA